MTGAADDRARTALLELARLFDTALTREADAAEQARRAHRNLVLAAAASAWRWESLSPAGLFSHVSQRLADTGPWRWDDALTAVARSRAAVIAWGDEHRITEDPSFFLAGEAVALPGFARVEEVPDTPVARRIQEALGPLGLLASLSVLAAGWGAALFVRYDVR